MFNSRFLFMTATLCITVFLTDVQNQAYCQDKDALPKVKAAKKDISNKDTSNKEAEQKLVEKHKAADSANATEKKEPTVIKVYSSVRKDGMAGIGDVIVIYVSNFQDLLDRAKSADKSISLYINGRQIDSIKPLSGAPDKDNYTFQYRLDRNLGNDKTWADILGAPPIFSDNFFVKDVKVSAGLANEFAIRTNSDDNNFSLIRIHRGWFWSCCLMVILYLFIVITMIRNRGLLRDRGINLAAIGIPTNSLFNPYSLGRFQMAFWFTITIISFFFIWLITDAYNIITTTVLTLIGISAGTSLSAAVIDDNKSTDILNQTIALQDELALLNIQIPSLAALVNAVPAPSNLVSLQTQLTTAQARVTQIPPLIARNKVILTPQKSQGFLKDILTDANGVSFHRLQMLVWTFVFGLIFLYSVWKRLSMPEFDGTLLALQGITAGTYLGFKFPEKQV